MRGTTFIYALKCPDSGRIRYIGKSDRPEIRAINHVKNAKCYPAKDHRACWISKLIQEEKRPILEVLDEVPYGEWQFWEREYIRVFRTLNFSLVNTADGGESPPSCKGKESPLKGIRKIKPSPLKGRRLPEETKEKMRLARLGKKCSLETRRKIGFANAGKPSPRKGTKSSEATKEKLRLAHRLRKSFKESKTV